MTEVWKPKEHSQIKETILESYLKAWYMKTTSGFRRVCYVDTCSGPGIFDNGMLGSPMIALKMAYEAWKRHPSCIYEFMFCDMNSDFLRKLKENVAEQIGCYEKEFNSVVRVSFYECDFLEEFDRILQGVKKKGTASFLFIDPFNASTVPFATIAKAVEGASTEVLYNFMHSDINRNKNLMSSEKKVRIMGGDCNVGKLASVPTIRDEFIANLREKTGAYIMHYTMKTSNRSPLYDLIHLTKHCDGLSIMKEVMSSLSKTPHYFSNDERYARDQLTIFGPRSQDSFYEVLKSMCGSEQTRVERLYNEIMCDDKLFWTKSSILEQIRGLLETGKIKLVSGPKRINKNSVIEILEDN